jgi:hypothetical protein
VPKFPPKFNPNIKNHPKKSRRDNDMKSVVIDSPRRELFNRNKTKNLPVQFILSIHSKGQKFTKNPLFTPTPQNTHKQLPPNLHAIKPFIDFRCLVLSNSTRWRWCRFKEKELSKLGVEFEKELEVEKEEGGRRRGVERGEWR